MDGTLADCRHRLHFLHDKGKKDWKGFFQAAEKDLPRQEILDLALLLAEKNALLIASGRPEDQRQQTSEWLKKYKVPFEKIYLRPKNDHRPDGAVKAEMIEQMKHDGFMPWLVVDDRQSAVDAWRKLGLCCLQCDESRY